MMSTIKENPDQTLGELQKSLNDLIRYVYLAGFQDGKALLSDNKELINKATDDRITKITNALRLN